jgi:tRNA dimethylallyltransferase
MNPPEPFYVCGPTASGKSSLALQLAREKDGEIVNADAFQLYRGIDTISAAPSEFEKSTAAHHLYGVLEPSETCDAQRFVDLARPVIDEIIARGKTPIVTGGSGLYLKFLTHGPSPVPPSEGNLRRELEVLTHEEIIVRLQALDPEEAAQINLTNRRYVSRSLEICILSGCKASTLRKNWQHVSDARTRTLQGLVIQRPRAILHQRIAERSTAMLEGNAIEEVRALRSQLSITCAKAIGVPQILAFLDGQLSHAECLQKIIEATRQYAKRQETWFRRESWLTPCPMT